MKCSCEYCGGEFDKPQKEWNRSEKLGRKHFCCLSCSTSYGNKIHPRGQENLKKARKRTKDEYSPFRYFARKARNRTNQSKRFNKCDVSPKYLKQLFESQDHRCPLTGWKLELPQGGNGFVGISSSPRQASLNRIDSNKGYIQGNVRFIAYQANIARNGFSDKQLREFCSAVNKNKAS